LLADRSQRQARNFTATSPSTPAPEAVLAATTVAVVRQNGHMGVSPELLRVVMEMTAGPRAFLLVGSGCRFWRPSTVLAGRSVHIVQSATFQEIAMPSNTVKLHRVLRSTPDRVFRAFIDPDAMSKWLPPHGFTGKVHSMDARVGGGYKMSFKNFTTGDSHSFGGKFLELVPGERLRYTDQFDDPNLPGEMVTTVTIKKVSVGVELNVVQEGIPEAIPAEACYLGWQESLTLLTQLVEAEIKQP
jgi:uncharacterized protein YndB with AHSA1/START domain